MPRMTFWLGRSPKQLREWIVLPRMNRTGIGAYDPERAE
ncbi:hypothetical protein BIWAKO_02820 [Bosea sp. BIWAKO-01]|nr:hypothetical protein BIWAKO_02820 [Bosea sp. BIWAKO-01]